ncbi:hypothetical protein K458DRAFT_444196 [Lentithecium fluviatile CBS 122367]|uniref:Fatty acid desaturase domain-containing protein n=1 Tax=Lentithecium fluviatile CBS 122367 TaxID=1168545 RepID=A0A6G1IUW7_9PLEO|nr:hypothetical protein K458DRAFT_444196 [Lentithecium fluviatile CBS 122367]
MCTIQKAATLAPASLAIATSSEMPLPLSSLEEDSDVKKRPARQPQSTGAVTLRGLFYIMRDISMFFAVLWIAQRYIIPNNIASVWLRGLLWSIYGFINGLSGTALLVPYFSWIISHGKPHKATGHMERDMVFIPRTSQQYAERFKIAIGNLSEVAEDTPLYSFLNIFAGQLFGWPVYLFTNDNGHNLHERQPEGRGIGKRRDAKWILISDIGVVTALVGLYMPGQIVGWLNLAISYLLPYLWVNHWLGTLNIWHRKVSSAPTFAPGSERMDRFVGRRIFHGIADTHVLHHYVSVIAFYHAEKASEAIRPVTGAHYRSDTKSGAVGCVKELWTVFRLYQWVEPSEGVDEDLPHVLFYRNRTGLGTKPAVLNLKGQNGRA